MFLLTKFAQNLKNIYISNFFSDFQKVFLLKTSEFKKSSCFKKCAGILKKSSCYKLFTNSNFVHIFKKIGT